MKYFAPLLLILAAIDLAPAQQRDAFDRLDKDKDGKLTKEELPAAARRNFDRADTDGDGSISRAEDAAFRKRGRPRGDGNAKIEILRDLRYADTDNPRQKLDLFLPKGRATDAKPLPVIAFIHGGAWRSGDKRGGLNRLAAFVENGDYAGVSIAYRLSAEAHWPAQIHDCKAAIRWLRANAEKRGLDAEKIAVWGTSAGGHLVAMLGTSGGVRELEGGLGKHLDQSSRVTCVVNFFGPSELLTMGEHPSRINHNAADSPESLLVGGALQEHKAKARSASPITHVTKDDAPTLNIHGSADQLVPYPQSVEFNKRLVAAGVSSNLITVDGGGHGNFGKAGAEIDRLVREFLASHLRGGQEASTKDHTLSATGK